MFITIIHIVMSVNRFDTKLWLISNSLLDCFVQFKEKMCKHLNLGYLHLCPRMDFLLTLRNNDSLYTNYENVFIELDR